MSMLRRFFFMPAINGIRLRISLYYWVWGFIVCARRNTAMQKEINTWSEGFIITLMSAPAKPAVGLKKEKAGLTVIDITDLEHSDIGFIFKSPVFLLSVASGKLGIYEAFSEKRFYVKGEWDKAISVLRTLRIAESMLFHSQFSERYGRYNTERISRLGILCRILWPGNSGKKDEACGSEVLRICE